MTPVCAPGSQADSIAQQAVSALGGHLANHRLKMMFFAAGQLIR